MSILNFLKNIFKNCVIACAFFVAGYVGIKFSTPPDIAVIFWPAAGVALGAFLVCGRCAIVGVYVGALITQFYLLYLNDGTLDFIKNWHISALISLGAVLQGMFGSLLAKKLCDFPNIFSESKKILQFLLYCGFLSSLVSTSIGNTTLWYFGVIDSTQFLSSWFDWWVGDSLGIITFTPVLYVVFSSTNSLLSAQKTPKTHYLKRILLSMIALITLAIPLFLTFYVWDYTKKSEITYKKSEFLYLVVDCREALTKRLLSYETALKAGVGFFAALSDNFVTETQFRNFTENMDFLESFYGLNGIGYVSDIPKEKIEEFIQKQKSQGRSDFKITPEVHNDNFIVTYVEPISENRSVVGLNLAFEEKRRNAAIKAKETGKTVISEFVEWSVSNQNALSFFIFLPIYKPNLPLDTIEQRNNAFLGWVNSMFVAKKFFYGLSDKQSSYFRLKIFDGFGDHSENLIYDSNLFVEPNRNPLFVEQQVFSAFGKILTIRWESTKIFEDTIIKPQTHNILYGGFCVASLISIFLMYFVSRNQQIQQSVMKQTLKLETSQAELIKSQNVLRIAMDNAPIGMALITAEGSWLKVNKAVYQLFGYTSEEFEKIKFHDLMCGNYKNYTQDFYALLNQEIDNYQTEKCAICKNGDIIWINITVSAVFYTSAAPEYVIVQFENITKRKEVERIKSEFVSVVSHELRTPLTSIRGALGLIVGGLQDEISERALNLAKMAQKNSDRLMQLINDILDIDKIASGAMEFKMQNYDLNALVKQTVEENIAYVSQYNVKIKGYFINLEVLISVDERRFVQILSNIISNAAKFSHPNNIIVISTSLENDIAKIEVQDFGVGMPEAFSEKIFQKFSQVDSTTTRAKGGTGLGLHITKQMVEKMNGSIHFSTKLGEGTIFWIEFPISEIKTPEKRMEIMA